jgi:hypothetical protein
MDPDQPVHPRSPISIHAVRLQVEKLIADSMNPDQTARMCRLVWIHAGRKPLCWFFRDEAHIVLHMVSLPILNRQLRFRSISVEPIEPEPSNS